MTDDDLPRLPGVREAALRRRHATVHALAEHRRAAGLSQTEVAARMGTSQSTVARLEAGEVDPRLSTLDRYAEALGGVLDVELRFEPATVIRLGSPTLTELPGPAAEFPRPGQNQPFRPAAQLPPPPAAPLSPRPPTDRRW